MSTAASIFFALSICVILYRHFKYRADTQTKLNEISRKLKEISDTGSDEKIMIFTGDKAFISLAEQINRLLEDRQKIRANYRHSEIASKKMLSNISHDIKTPMTVILGYLEMLHTTRDPDGEMLRKVESKVHQVVDLINQFFTLAKLEAGDMDLKLSRLNINEICRENILDFYGLLSQEDIFVDLDIPEEIFYAQANKEALQRILSNLISNAIRYGGEGKYLGLSLRQDKENVYVDVSDKGRGIEKEFISDVFDRLFTMEDSRNSQMQGNGLGLTIAKNLAIQSGGNITLESHPHERTVFTLTLKR